MSSTTFRCYLAGSQSLLIHCAEALLQGGHTVCGVVTDAPQLVEWAGSRGIPVLAPGRDLAERLEGPFDYFFSITNLSIIPKEVLSKASRGGVNFHDGPLPAYAGLYVTAWALINREPSHGVTWHVMTDAVDEGDILEQQLFDLEGDETSFVLNTRCYQAAIDSFGQLIGKLAAGTVKPREQPSEGRSYFGLSARPAAAGTLDFSRPSGELTALVRALDFGPVENPLALAKLGVGDELVTVSAARAAEGRGEPGRVLHVSDEELVVATGDGAIALRDLRCPLGVPVSVAGLAKRQGLEPGAALPALAPEIARRISEVNEAVCRHEPFWARRLEKLSPIEIPQAQRIAEPGAARSRAPLTIPEPARSLSAEELLTAWAVYLGRVGNASAFDLAFCEGSLADRLRGVERYFATHVPLHVELAPTAGFDAATEAMAAELERVRRRGTYAVDAVGRHPALRQRPSLVGSDRWRVAGVVVGDPAAYEPPAGAELAVAFAADGAGCTWHHDPRVLSADVVASMQRQFATLLAGIALDRGRPLAEQPLLSEAERRRVLVEWNQTAAEYPRDTCLHTAFEQQVERTPDAPALACLETTLSYAELDARANRLAHHLIGLGVGPDVLVGVCIERSVDMVVAALAVLKAGGAYVPMDPGYPPDRIALMVEDSRVAVLLSRQTLASRLPSHGGRTVLVDADWSEIAERPATRPASAVGPANLAYVIYTSGSTGRPKGVMVEHRNVVNFFAGMDERVAGGSAASPGVWLAVTSLSFDISVLELFWTLARGFEVVLHSDTVDHAALTKTRQRQTDRPISFSLMYFASDEGEHDKAADKYRLLLDGTRFGDQNGFVAVWTPERHFHAFGGLYPNPSVAAAALATITTRIGLRAASVVAPLHHPIRIAEEWALVDNLSGGRVGISFAAGWQPNDFILREPERFHERKQVMLQHIETVRRLWRGEAFEATSPLGKRIEVRTLPRPVQKELPFWVTAAGNPETFRAAGEIGANVLTHLLGQTVEEVREKIGIYREARARAGHPGPGTVTMMLHTFVGPDADAVKEIVRGPMKSYLGSSLELIKQAAWTFPTFKQKADATGRTPAQVFEEEDLSDEDRDAVLEHAFNRYYETSGLFGTPSGCLAMIGRLRDIGVDEVGCLLDYGVPSSTVLAHLKYLGELKALATATATPTEADYSIAGQVRRHGVTHVQCTPTQLGLILADPEARAAVRGLKKVLVGGEAFPAQLAADLRAATDGEIINMYGPTETTIWSSTQIVAGDGGPVSIGRPIANTQLYILDQNRQPVPVGTAGELYIGGDGVVRGYWERPELTAERFVADPFSAKAGARLYRTGDLARHREDGAIEFLGRVDFQVKLRGFRIELGEIEAAIAREPAVREAVAIAREDVPGDVRLVAYMVAEAGRTIEVDALRSRLRETLPEYMVPSSFVVIDEWPLTPNAKLDRKALPAPDRAPAPAAAGYVAPEGGLEAAIADVWASVLNVEKVGVDDNFFDLGGHSLLTVQVHRQLRDVVDKPLGLTDLFRFPTIRSLVGFLGADGESATVEKGRDRADARRAARERRASLNQSRRR